MNEEELINHRLETLTSKCLNTPVGEEKYFVVRVGDYIGTWSDWRSIELLTQRFPKTKYEVYETLEEAEIAFGSCGVRTPLTAKRLAEDAANRKRRKPTRKRRRGVRARKTTQSKSKTSLARTVRAPESGYDFHIFYDGACWPNPNGPSGSGIVVYRDMTLFSAGYGRHALKGTNNRAELQGLLDSLRLAEKLQSTGVSVQILSDSKYTLCAMLDWSPDWIANDWYEHSPKELKNLDLIIPARNLFQTVKPIVDLVHVKAHSGVQGNEIADALAKKAKEDEVKGFKILKGAKLADFVATMNLHSSRAA